MRMHHHAISVGDQWWRWTLSRVHDIRNLRVTGWDVMLLFVLPTLLMAWHFDRNRLDPRGPYEYAPIDPTAFTLYANHFTHSNVGHLSGNMKTLWVVGGLAFVLLCATRNKGLYYGTCGLFATAFPVLAEPFLHTTLLYFQPGRYAVADVVGFSGILSGLVAVLASAVALYFRARIAAWVSPYPVTALLSIAGMLTVTVYKDWSHSFLVAAALALVLVSGYLGYALYTSYENPDVQPHHIVVALIGLAVFFYYSHRMLAQKSHGMGFNVHLLGYLGGVIFSLGVMTVQDVLRAGRRTLCGGNQ